MVVRDDWQGLWADAEDVGKELVRPIEIGGRPVARVGRETAAGKDLDGGTIRVERIGGEPDRLGLADFPLLEFALFGVDYDQVKAMRRALWQAMTASIGHELALPDGSRALIQVARIENGPIRPPWATEKSTRRVIETWRLSWPPYFES